MRETGDLGRLPVVFDPRAISLEEGIRAGLSIAALVVADYLFHAPVLLEAALGALLTCLADAGGTVSKRLPALLSLALIGGLLTAGFGLLRPLGAPIIPLACFAIFLFSLARIYTPAAQQVGNLLSVVLVLSLDHRFAALRPALILAGAFVGGALWAVLVTMVVWRLHPNRPARQAVGRVCLALEAMADDMRQLMALHEGPEAADWDRHARQHRRAVREWIEAARQIIGERMRAGGTAAPSVSRALLRLEALEQLFALLIGLTELMQSSATPADRRVIGSVARRLGAVLRALAPFIVEDTDTGQAELARSIGRIAARVASLPIGSPLRQTTALLVERLTGAMNLTGATPILAKAPNTGILDLLRTNLSWKSAALRHALRTAVVAAAGLGITFTWPGPYEHWLTITLVLTLQPYFAATLLRALERIGGTVAGGLVAAGLSLVCHTPLAIAAALLPLSMLALSLRAVNFALYTAVLTPMVVLLVEFGAHGQPALGIVVLRGVYAVIGGVLAILGCLLLWPSWEPDRLSGELRIAVQSHLAYARQEICLLQGRVPATAVDAARRAAGMASNNFEASLNRALLEPGKLRPRLEAALVVDAALRRMAGRLTAMQLANDPADAAVLGPWHDWLEAVGQALAQPVPAALPPRPDLARATPGLADSLARLALQFELLGGALRRYAA